MQNDTAGITIVRNHNVLARPRIPKDPGGVRLGEVEEDSIPDAGDVYTEYLDPQRGTWASVILPVLKSVAARAILQATGMSRRSIQGIRNEGVEPRSAHRKLLEAFVEASARSKQ